MRLHGILDHFWLGVHPPLVDSVPPSRACRLVLGRAMLLTLSPLVPDLHRYVPASSTARLLVRAVLAGLCFVIAVVLSVLPGPAFLFWIAGFVLLGVSVGQLLLSIHAIRELVHRRFPRLERVIPRLRKQHIRRVMRHRWVRMLDRLSRRHERRRRRVKPTRRLPPAR